MSKRTYIKRILSAVLSVLVAGGVLLLLIAAINKKNSRTCAGFNIQIKAVGGKSFISQKEVFALLTANNTDKLIGKTIASFDLKKKEEMIKKNNWIRDAQVFFDNNEILRVNVMEREPIGRIFTGEGETYYIDSSGSFLPLMDRMPTKVPVFTNFPRKKAVQHGADSILIKQVIALCTHILNDPFWMAQIEQVNINNDKTFDMVASVGSHLIEFGDGNDIEQKFKRLFIFYKQVMTKTGFEKYGKIDVRYAGQIVATRRGASMGKIDSLKASRNIDQLIRTARFGPSEDFHQQNTLPLEHNIVSERTLTNYDMIPNADEKMSEGPAKSPDKPHQTIKRIQPKIKTNP
jgi:cell division protein FtsQ